MMMQWDFEDQLQQRGAFNGGGGDGLLRLRRRRPARAQGDRAAERHAHKERIYLGGFEIYREYNGIGTR